MKKLALPLLIATAALFVSCAKDDSASQPAAGRGAAAQPATAFETRLAGRWHNNDHERAGATKQFTPDRGNPRRGRADGFWPLGGTYQITAVNAAARTLELTVKSDPADGDQPSQSFSATLQFADRDHFTVTRITGQGGPSRGLTFYRVR